VGRAAPLLFRATDMHHVQLTAASHLLLHVVGVRCREMILEAGGLTLPFRD